VGALAKISEELAVKLNTALQTNSQVNLAIQELISVLDEANSQIEVQRKRIEQLEMLTSSQEDQLRRAEQKIHTYENSKLLGTKYFTDDEESPRAGTKLSPLKMAQSQSSKQESPPS